LGGPKSCGNSPEAKLLGTEADRKVYNIVHLIYRAKDYECHSKDYEFPGSAWRGTGAPDTTMPGGRYAIPRCRSGPPITKASSL
jgi:hypothetical protein